MRLFVVHLWSAVDNVSDEANGNYMTVVDLQALLSKYPEAPRAEKTAALDEALLAMINIAHVGMVIPFRLGWVFCAEDTSA